MESSASGSAGRHLMVRPARADPCFLSQKTFIGNKNLKYMQLCAILGWVFLQISDRIVKFCFVPSATLHAYVKDRLPGNPFLCCCIRYNVHIIVQGDKMVIKGTVQRYGFDWQWYQSIGLSSLFKGDVPRFSADFNHPLSCERHFKFLRPVVRNLGILCAVMGGLSFDTTPFRSTVPLSLVLSGINVCSPIKIFYFL